MLASGALNDTAVDAYYPTGSTFKPITALGALRVGLITAQTRQGGGAAVHISNKYFHNSGGADMGNLDLVQALARSEDTYFYLVGAAANGPTGNGHAIQNEARWLGLGSSPGIDLPGGGSAGLVPDRAVIDRINAQKLLEYCDGTRVKPAYAHNALAVNTCSQRFYDPPWTVGQNVGLATGQSYLEASPLQMVVAYSAIANDGTVWQPQIGMQVLSPSGKPVQQLQAPAHRHVAISAADRAVVLQGLHDAAQSPSGTSYAVFRGFPYTVYGKTGTAVVATPGGDQSWYVCYVPDGSKSIVLAVTVEHGGFGAAAAAPAARLMLSQWFGLPRVFLPGPAARTTDEHAADPDAPAGPRPGGGPARPPDGAHRRAARARHDRPGRRLARHARGPQPHADGPPGRVPRGRPGPDARPHADRLLAPARGHESLEQVPGRPGAPIGEGPEFHGHWRGPGRADRHSGHEQEQTDLGAFPHIYTSLRFRPGAMDDDASIGSPRREGSPPPGT